MTLKSVTSINFKSTKLFIVVNFLILLTRQASSVPIQLNHRLNPNQPNLGHQPNIANTNIQGPPQQFQDLNLLWESDENLDYSFMSPPIYQPIQNSPPNYIVPERTEQSSSYSQPITHHNPYEYLPHLNPQQVQGNNYPYRQQVEAPPSNFHQTQQQYPPYSSHEQQQQQQQHQQQQHQQQRRPPQYRPPDVDLTQPIYHHEIPRADQYYHETRQYANNNNNPNIAQYEPLQKYYNPNYVLGPARQLDMEPQVNAQPFHPNPNYSDDRREPQIQPQTFYKIPDQNRPNSIEKQRPYPEFYNSNHHVKNSGNHPSEATRESERSYPDFSQFPEQQQQQQQQHKNRQQQNKTSSQKYNRNQSRPVTINAMKIIYSEDKNSNQRVNSSLSKYRTNPINEISIIYPISISGNAISSSSNGKSNNQSKTGTAILIIEFDVSEATETMETTLETTDTETNEIVQEKS